MYIYMQKKAHREWMLLFLHSFKDILLKYLKKMLIVQACHPRKLDESQEYRKKNDNPQNPHTQMGDR